MDTKQSRTDTNAVSIFYMPLILAVAFVIAAGAHRLGLDNPVWYRNSWLIPAEFILLIGTAATVLAVTGLAFGVLIRRNWLMLRHASFSVVASATLLVAGVKIDSPTLLYMT